MHACRPPQGVPFFKILVPTVDTFRNRYLLSALIRNDHHCVLTGQVGVGKTMIAQSLLDELTGNRTAMTINFSAQTSSNSLQDTIEVR